MFTYKGSSHNMRHKASLLEISFKHQVNLRYKITSSDCRIP